MNRAAALKPQKPLSIDAKGHISLRKADQWVGLWWDCGGILRIALLYSPS